MLAPLADAMRSALEQTQGLRKGQPKPTIYFAMQVLRGAASQM
jgi:hypothetical protein